MSNLSALEYIQNRSEATTGLFNQRFSVISANFAALNSAATISFPSGNTLSVFSSIDASGNLHAGNRIGVGVVPSADTVEVMTIGADSSKSDYILFHDSSGARSNYIIGSRVGGTADGLNIWDASGQTMIASFSKQSIRFFQNVVGPVFDVGGALASTYNAATFSGSTTTVQIQAAISQASIDGVKRVYVPASMYPYKADRITFDTNVQMVREGGDWSVYDVFAYGAAGVGTDDRSIQAAANGAAANKGTCFFPATTYNVATSITLNAITDTQFRGAGGNGALIAMAASGITLLRFTGICSRVIIRDIWLGAFASRAAGGSIEITGSAGVHSDGFLLQDVILQNTPYPLTCKYLDAANFNNLRVISSITGAVKGNGVNLNNCISDVFQEFSGQVISGASFPTDIVLIADDCDTVLFSQSQCIGAIGYGFRLSNVAGGTGPRLTRFTDVLSESNTSGGFLVEAVRDMHFSSCHAAVNGGPGYNITGGDGVQIHDSLAYQNSGDGIIVSSTSAPRGVEISGCICTNNGQATDNTYDGINIGSGTSGIRIANNRSGDFFLTLPNKQRSGISIAASTDYITAINNDVVGNKTAGFASASTGTNNLVVDSSYVTTSSIGQMSWLASQFFQDGTALAPSIGLQSDRSLGFYKFGAKTLQLSAGTLQVDQFSAVAGALDQSNTSNVVRISGGASAKIQLATQATVGKLIQLENVGTATGAVFRVSQPGTVIFETGGGPAFAAWGPDGTVLAPFWTFSSERSLGFWRSGVSRLGFSYGQFSLPDGSNTTPSIGLSSATSVGFYSSGVQTIAQSLGTLNLATNSVRFSMRTLAASAVTASAAKTNVAVNEVVFTIGGASGASLIIYSGGTAYGFNSAFSAAVA